MHILAIIILCMVAHGAVTQQCTSAQLDVNKCNDITCGLNLNTGRNLFNFSSHVGCACTTSDYSARFTECTSGGTKSLFYFWKPPATCVGGVALPPRMCEKFLFYNLAIFNIPCALRCSAGQFLQPLTAQCQSCYAGQYSSGNTFKMTKWQNKWPSQMRSFCYTNYNTQKCAPWRLMDSYADSGDNKQNWDLGSELKWYGEAEEGGTVSFQYWVQADYPGDWFGFYLMPFDGTDHLRIRTSEQLTWANFTIRLEKGPNELTWMFWKNWYGTRGEDMARIRNLQITGLVNVDTECTACPAGTFSTATGSSECTPCAANTYQDEEGKTSCKSCPPFTESYPGSTSCFASNYPCTINDYYYILGNCMGGQQTMSAKWIQPQLCNSTTPESVILPSPSVRGCSTVECAPGMEPTGFTCAYCSNGYSSAGLGVACSKCQAGKFSASKKYYIENFYDASIYETWCTGQCLSGGWRYAGDFIDSGSNNGVGTSLATTGSITFSYILSCHSEYASLEFYIDRVFIKNVQCSGCNSEYKQVSLTDIPAGTHTIRVVYRTITPNTNYLCNRAVITKMIIDGAVDGGADQCLACNAGTFSSEAATTCTNCPPGSRSDFGAPMCKECSVNTFQDREGSPFCYFCGQGMTSRAGSTSCSWRNSTSCLFETLVLGQNRQFAWQDLGAALLNTPIAGTNLYLNLNASENSVCGKNMYACKNVNGTIVNYGNSPSMSISENNDLIVSYSNFYSNCSSGLRTIVNLKCYDSELFTPRIISDDGCTVTIQIDSIYGCYLCKQNDWVESYGPCENGQQIVIYAKTTTCSRGVKRTSSVQQCVANVVFPYWVFAVIIFALVGLIVVSLLSVFVAAIMYRRHRTLTGEFQRLVDEHSSQSQQL